MDHNTVRHILSEYIDGEASANEKAEIEAHLKTCRHCRDALEELRKAIDQIKLIEEAEPLAWMTQGITREVHAGAEKKKRLFQKSFHPISAKLPILAAAVLILAVILFYIYQNLLPMPKSTEASLQGFSCETGTSPPIAARQEQMVKGSSLQSKHVPQSPGYKALDMRLEYEKPAHPAVEGKEMSAETNGGKISLTLRVPDIVVAAQDVEKTLLQLNGKIIRKEVRDHVTSLYGTINSARLQGFFEKLKTIGKLEVKAVTSKHYAGEVALEVVLRKPYPTSQ